jgi:hypothetical protein
MLTCLAERGVKRQTYEYIIHELHSEEGISLLWNSK